MRYFDLHCDTLVACLDQNKSLIDNDLHVSVKKGDRFAPYVQCAAVWLPDSVRGAAALQYFDRHAAYFRKMAETGFKRIEAVSFVSPKAIPQLADSKAVTEAVLKKYPGLDLFALVPNLRGAQNAYELGLRKVCYVVSLSKSHNKANINRTHEQSLEAYKEIRSAYPDLNIVVDLATTFGCPFEGKYDDPQAVVDFLKDYIDAGMTTCCLCDTIGIADPAQVKAVIGALKAAYPTLNLQVHFHDTRGLGMVNTMAAIESGITEVQSALGGLGGCPFAPGASGNLSTEDMIWMLNEMGYETGIEFSKVLAAAKYQASHIPGNYSGHHIHIEQETPCKF